MSPFLDTITLGSKRRPFSAQFFHQPKSFFHLSETLLGLASLPVARHLRYLWLWPLLSYQLRLLDKSRGEGSIGLAWSNYLAITAAENWSMSPFVRIQKMCEDVYTCSLWDQKDDHKSRISGQKDDLQSRFFIYPRRSLMLHCLFARRFSLLQSKPLYECIARNGITRVMLP